MPKYQIFADEAWTHNSEPLARYHFFFGGIFGLESDLDKLDQDLKKILVKHKFNPRVEIKWAKVRESDIPCFKELIDCLKTHILADKIKYRQMFKDRSYHYDNRDNLSELDMQFRLYYQFTKNSFGFKYLPRLVGNEKHEILLRLDGHSSQKHKDSLNTFVTNLPTYLQRPDIELKITYVDSKDFLRLQICDLLMGAAGYRGNRICDRRPNGRRGMTAKQKMKLELAKYIYETLKEINHLDRGSNGFNWFESTGFNQNKSNMYHHKLRIWKFIPSEYRKNKGWEKDNLTREGYFVRDIFEDELNQGYDEEGNQNGDAFP